MRLIKPTRRSVCVVDNGSQHSETRAVEKYISQEESKKNFATHS